MAKVQYRPSEEIGLLPKVILTHGQDARTLQTTDGFTIAKTRKYRVKALEK